MYPNILFLQDPFYYDPTIYILVLQVVSFLQVSPSPLYVPHWNRKVYYHCLATDVLDNSMVVVNTIASHIIVRVSCILSPWFGALLT